MNHPVARRALVLFVCVITAVIFSSCHLLLPYEQVTARDALPREVNTQTTTDGGSHDLRHGTSGDLSDAASKKDLEWTTTPLNAETLGKALYAEQVLCVLATGVPNQKFVT